MPPLSLAAIRQAITDPHAAQQLLQRYFTVRANDDHAFCFNSTLRSEAIYPSLGPIRLEPAMFGITDIVGAIERKLRKQRYRHALRHGLPRVIAEGDSWFSHPLLLDVVDQLGEHYAVFDASNPGDDLGDMVRDLPDLKDTLREEKPAVMIFSGGGNDSIGRCFHMWLQPATGDGEGHRHIRWPAFERHLERVMRDYRTFLHGVLDTLPGLQVVFHGYDYAVPVPFGERDHPRVSGPQRLAWLSKPLDAAGVTRDAERRLVIRLLVDHVNERLAVLAREHPRAHHLDLRGTLDAVNPNDDWYDELHPTNDGFTRVGARFTALVEPLLP